MAAHKSGGARAGAGRRAARAGPPRHFLDIDQYRHRPSCARILDLGVAYKNGRRDRPLAGKTWR